MASYMTKLKESWKEAAVIGGVGFAAVYLGGADMVVNSTAAWLPSDPAMRRALVTGFVVFSSDIIYSLFLTDYIKF